jgi:enediyne biosynthesis protein E4
VKLPLAAIVTTLAAASISFSSQEREASSEKRVQTSDWGVTLTDVAERAGLTHTSVYGGIDRKRFIIETNGCGTAFIDYDNDGWIDALVLSGTRLAASARADSSDERDRPPSRLYKNQHDGTFTDVTAQAGLSKIGWASSVCAGDYDNDGFIDLFVTYYGSNVLYRNLGNGRFEDVSSRAGLTTSGIRWGSGCTFVDFDRDGRLDLFVANYLKFDLQTAKEPGDGINCTWKGVPVNCGPKGLPTDTNLLYHNDGGGRFTDVSSSSGIDKVTGRYSMTALAADFDADGWTDIYVASDSTAAILYRNNRDGTFTDVAISSGAAYSENGNPQAGMGVAAADYDGDGRLDLLKTHFADDVPALYRNVGMFLFEDVATRVGLAVENRFVEWGTGMPDLDLDGRPDIVYVTGNVYPEVEARMAQYPHRGPRVIFRNTAQDTGSRFENVTNASGQGATAPHSSRGAAFGDFDNDGDLDVLVMNMNEPPSLLRNEYVGKNHWIELQLEGSVSNRSAIGALVTVKVNGRSSTRALLSQSSYYSHDDVRLHFGLGDRTIAQSIAIRWPSGTAQSLTDVKGDRVVRIRETRTQ